MTSTNKGLVAKHTQRRLPPQFSPLLAAVHMRNLFACSLEFLSLPASNIITTHRSLFCSLIHIGRSLMGGLVLYVMEQGNILQRASWDGM
jgi:hypothetical protein